MERGSAPAGAGKSFKRGILLRGPRGAAPHRGLPHPELTGEILRTNLPPNPKAHPEVLHPPPDAAKPLGQPRLCPPREIPRCPSPVPSPRTGQGEAGGGGGDRFGSFQQFVAFLRYLPARESGEKRCAQEYEVAPGHRGSAAGTRAAPRRLQPGRTGASAAH